MIALLGKLARGELLSLLLGDHIKIKRVKGTFMK